jgi:hypothetical protein
MRKIGRPHRNVVTGPGEGFRHERVAHFAKPLPGKVVERILYPDDHFRGKISGLRKAIENSQDFVTLLYGPIEPERETRGELQFDFPSDNLLKAARARTQKTHSGVFDAVFAEYGHVHHGVVQVAGAGNARNRYAPGRHLIVTQDRKHALGDDTLEKTVHAL